MKKRFFAPLAFAGLAPLLGGTAASAVVPVNGTTQYCPFTFMNSASGPDPDYVTFLGPSALSPGLGHVSIGISEEEAAPNAVNIVVVATSSDIAHVVVTAASGTHDTTVDVPLPEVTGRTWTLNWVATFDMDIHPCTSLLPGYSAFTVKSA